MKRVLDSESLFKGDCLKVLPRFPEEAFDMIYVDPPFYTGRVHKGSDKYGVEYSFNDTWKSEGDYYTFLRDRIKECYRTLKSTGSLFFHCDHNNVSIGKLILDEIFGKENFLSEIIWYYKRWSNSKKGLLQQHQTILLYSKSGDFKWNMIHTGYSPTTNVDQILQKRSRDSRGKSVYAKDERGKVVSSDQKKGVPLGDVWEIPLLNPKASERTGYPTQKPIVLLERMISLTTNPGDQIMDPFCGSGTTLVAAQLSNRLAIGIDISEKALKLTHDRLSNPIKSSSPLLSKGTEAYLNTDPWVEAHLLGFNYTRVQRNNGIDAILKEKKTDKHVCIRVQKEHESIFETIDALKKALKGKEDVVGVLIQTKLDFFETTDMEIVIIKSPAIQYELFYSRILHN